MSQEAAIAAWEANQDMSVDDLLPQVKAPTLILHRRDFAMLDLSVARKLASRIPDATLKVVEGASLSPYLGDIRVTLDVVNEFIGLDRAALGREPLSHDHAADSHAEPAASFATIMFTDMEGSTGLTQRLGDARAQELVRLHNTIVGSALYAQGGRQVKHTGDGIMASFPTASGALECAVAIQRAFQRHNEMNPEEQVGVRIGLNAGEPVADGDDLFGTAVQLASRVCNRADAGEILTSDVVRQLVAGKGFLFADRGEAELRGFEDSVRIFEVRWRENGA
jgi:class 3 adenylate cyclase